ncbi:hypothetical protein BSK56_13455 [Paenibacillus borealis]|uniref:Uncharacterized protein n=1 Tax=Paenibacillus borealis TaxID=160799 RepID=A0ABX3HB02_PAEBO|nr:hypothetical protein BSK56_13455 [Paenibacillus borealis]
MLGESIRRQPDSNQYRTRIFWKSFLHCQNRPRARNGPSSSYFQLEDHSGKLSDPNALMHENWPEIWLPKR